MNKIVAIALGLLFSTSAAFAAAPKGTGNFRRSEAVKAAGANSKSARVIGLTTADNRVAGPNNYKSSRILFVQDGSKVTLIKAPVDGNKAVSKLTKAQANRLGLVTQTQAKQIASMTTGGVFGTNGKVKVVAAGMGAKRGSYLFKQVAPSSEIVKQYGSTYKASNIVRSVSVTGKGESTSASMKKIGE
jgi:hypothetical protein